MSGSSQGNFRQLTKLPSVTADSDAQVGLGIPSSFTKPSLSGHFLYTGRCRAFLISSTYLMNSGIIHFRGTDFEVYQKLNHKIYSDIESDSNWMLRESEDAVIQLFVANREDLLSREIVDFLTQAGVDYQKENEIHHYKIEDKVIISGWYDIVGTIKGKETTGTQFLGTEKGTMNATFTNDPDIAIRPEFSGQRTFRLDFDILLY